MTVVPAQTTLPQDSGAVTQPLYAHMVGYDENAWFGVQRDPVAGYACYEIIVKPERDMVARYLMEAQAEVEAELGFPVQPKWFEDERRPYALPVLSQWGYVIEAGVEARDDILLDAAITHVADVGGVAQPSVTAAIVTTVTDESEIHVYYPASLNVEGPVEIHPSDIDLDTVAGTVTITIPRCRLVHPDFVNNPAGGLDYDDVALFLEEVDVIRVYNDPSTHATLVWPHTCTGSVCGCGPSCCAYTQDGCIYVADADIGRLDVLPAAYSDGWSRVTARCCGVPEYVLLNYRAGMLVTTRQAQDAITRLAHSKMPKEPCGCERARMIWGADREMPEVYTRERLNCRFGLSVGSWIAWQFCQAMKLVRAGTL